MHGHLPLPLGGYCNDWLRSPSVASSRRRSRRQRAFSDLMDSWFDSFHIPKITRRSVALSVCLSVSRVELDASFLLSSERTNERTKR